MNSRSTSDLKKLVLNECGELTDGTSDFDSVALNRLNSLHQGVIAGGDVFGVDVSEPWAWARAKHPMVINLDTAYETGGVTMTNGSVDGVFTSAPSTSMNGRYLKVTDVEDFYIIRKHNAGETSFQVDQVWIAASGTYTFGALPLEYDLADDNIVIDDFNCVLEFQNNSGVQVATLTKGVYTSPALLCTEIVTQMTAAGGSGVTCTFNALTRKFVVGHGGPLFSILIESASTPEATGWPTIGFDYEDHTGALSYTSDNVLNSIQRLVMPFTIYRNISPRWLAPEDTGKIYGMDLITLQRKYPLTQMYPYMPDSFAVIRVNQNGTIRVRLNTYPREQIRMEVDYIPTPADLKDNEVSEPLLPRAYREYLVYGACYYVMLNKSDNRAESYLNLAQAKLKAMVNDNRASKELTNNKFGKLIPRAILNRPWRTIP